MTSLYVIVDPEHCAGRDPRWVCEQALEGGAALLQLRAKRLADAALLSLARALGERCRAHGVPFWVNDRADIALLSAADGLHLGQDDLPPSEVRRLAPELALGLSTHSLEQAGRATEQPIQQIGFGPIFETTSKERPSPTVGLSGLEAVCRAFPALQVVAIGGIQLASAAQVARTGAAYAAVISAVCQAPEPRLAAKALCDALREGSASRPQR